MLTQQRLLSLLNYNPATGVFTWREDRTPSVRAGAVAGSQLSTGYIQIKVDERLYGAHRLAWFYIHGRWPTPCVDHRNMTKWDNRIENLREATRGQNNMNRRVPANNQSGFTGVGWNNHSKKWCARINIDGKRRNVGFFVRIEDAIAARAVAAETHYGQFAKMRG